MTPRPIGSDSDGLEELSLLHGRVFPARWSAEALRALLLSPGCFLLALGDDAIAGFIVARIAADEAEILTLAVAPEQRRRGLGRTLLEDAARRAHANGAVAMYLEVGVGNAPAIGLYRAMGFVEVGMRRGYYGGVQREHPEDALTFRASLPLQPLGNRPKTD